MAVPRGTTGVPAKKNKGKGKATAAKPPTQASKGKGKAVATPENEEDDEEDEPAPVAPTTAKPKGKAPAAKATPGSSKGKGKAVSAPGDNVEGNEASAAATASSAKGKGKATGTPASRGRSSTRGSSGSRGGGSVGSQSRRSANAPMAFTASSAGADPSQDPYAVPDPLPGDDPVRAPPVTPAVSKRSGGAASSTAKRVKLAVPVREEDEPVAGPSGTQGFDDDFDPGEDEEDIDEEDVDEEDAEDPAPEEEGNAPAAAANPAARPRRQSAATSRRQRNKQLAQAYVDPVPVFSGITCRPCITRAVDAYLPKLGLPLVFGCSFRNPSASACGSSKKTDVPSLGCIGSKDVCELVRLLGLPFVWVSLTYLLASRPD
jgi:hypothetical protein